MFFYHYLATIYALLSASTRKVYEKKLQKVLDQPPSEPPSAPEATELTADSNQNGNTNSDQYSDKEDGKLTFWTLFQAAGLKTLGLNGN